MAAMITRLLERRMPGASECHGGTQRSTRWAVGVGVYKLLSAGNRGVTKDFRHDLLRKTGPCPKRALYKLNRVPKEKVAVARCRTGA